MLHDEGVSLDCLKRITALRHKKQRRLQHTNTDTLKSPFEQKANTTHTIAHELSAKNKNWTNTLTKNEKQTQTRPFKQKANTKHTHYCSWTERKKQKLNKHTITNKQKTNTHTAFQTKGKHNTHYCSWTERKKQKLNKHITPASSPSKQAFLLFYRNDGYKKNLSR